MRGKRSSRRRRRDRAVPALATHGLDRPVVARAWRLDLVKGTTEGTEGTEVATDHPIQKQ